MEINLKALYIAIVNTKQPNYVIANKAGLHKSHFSKIMNGKTIPTTKTVMKICEALEIPVDTIIKSKD